MSNLNEQARRVLVAAQRDLVSVAVPPSRVKAALCFVEGCESTTQALRAIVAALASLDADKEAAALSSIVNTVAALEVESM